MREKQVDSWNPKWLSLPGAMMWTVTRDETLTRKVDERADNDHNILFTIDLQLAWEKAQTGSDRRCFVDSKDAWRELRSLIADEKIIAEGLSLVIHVRCTRG